MPLPSLLDAMLPGELRAGFLIFALSSGCRPSRHVSTTNMSCPQSAPGHVQHVERSVVPSGRDRAILVIWLVPVDRQRTDPHGDVSLRRRSDGALISPAPAMAGNRAVFSRLEEGWYGVHARALGYRITDEYTHDVVMPFVGDLFLVFDAT
jgi:hypothetical protein